MGCVSNSLDLGCQVTDLATADLLISLPDTAAAGQPEWRFSELRSAHHACRISQHGGSWRCGWLDSCSSAFSEIAFKHALLCAAVRWHAAAVHCITSRLARVLPMLALQVLGYDEEGRVLNYVGVATPTPADVTAAASHIVNFIDIGGHEKYMKTTLYGMTCLLPGRRVVLELLALVSCNRQGHVFNAAACQPALETCIGWVSLPG